MLLKKILMNLTFNVRKMEINIRILEHSHFCMIAKSWRRQIRRWREITNQELQEFSWFWAAPSCIPWRPHPRYTHTRHWSGTWRPSWHLTPTFVICHWRRWQKGKRRRRCWWCWLNIGARCQGHNVIIPTWYICIFLCTIPLVLILQSHQSHLADMTTGFGAPQI